jgi:hypothetical protein
MKKDIQSTSEEIRTMLAILENLELNFTGGRSGHGHVYSARPVRVYGDEGYLNNEEDKSEKVEKPGKVKISKVFLEEDDV